MKSFILILLLSFIQTSDAPIGTWEYKQDKSRMEIKNRNGKINGILISTHNPNRNPGNEILKNMEYREGKWSGEFYLYKSDRWVLVSLEIKGNLLFMEYTYGIQTNSLHFYSVK